MFRTRPGLILKVLTIVRLLGPNATDKLEEPLSKGYSNHPQGICDVSSACFRTGCEGIEH